MSPFSVTKILDSGYSKSQTGFPNTYLSAVREASTTPTVTRSTNVSSNTIFKYTVKLSANYSDDLPIILDLIGEVEEEIRLQEYQTISYYMREIRALEDELALHKRVWNRTTTVANKVIKAITVIRKGIVMMDKVEAGAGKD